MLPAVPAGLFRRFSLRALAALTLALNASPRTFSQTPAWTSLQGLDSAISRPRRVVVLDDATWEKLWAEHARGTMDERAAAPAVDFTREAVVATFLGERADSTRPFELRKIGMSEAARFETGAPEAADSDLRDAIGRLSVRLVSQSHPARVDTLAFDGGPASAAGFVLAQDQAVPRQRVPPQPPSEPRQPAEPQQPPAEPQTPPEPEQAPPAPTQPAEPEGSERRDDRENRQDRGDRGDRGGHDDPRDHDHRGDRGHRDDHDGDQGGNQGGRRYRPRPDDGYRGDRPGDGIQRERSRVSTAGRWRVYRDRWGRIEEEFGAWESEQAGATIRRGGSETGVGQYVKYGADLQSRATRDRYVLYWRWLGYNCDPRDQDYCERWLQDWRWFHEDTFYGPSRFMHIDLEFASDMTLLPWEQETIRLYFDGARVWTHLSDPAFRYSETGPIVDQGRDVATITLTPLARVLRSPEANRVTARLEAQDGRLVLVVDDARASFYAGETLELKWSLWKVKRPSWSNPFGRDSKIYERNEQSPERITVDAASPRRPVTVGDLGGDEYYVKWGFRRAASRISSGEWKDRDQTNKVKK